MNHTHHAIEAPQTYAPTSSDAALKQIDRLEIAALSAEIEIAGISADLEAARFVADLMARIIANGLHLDPSLQ